MTGAKGLSASQRLADPKEASLDRLLRNTFLDDQITELKRYLVERNLESSEVVFRQGDASDGMYFLENGSVEIMLNIESDQPIRLRKLGPGTLFGEMSVYTVEPRSASVRVVDDARLYFLSTRTMKTMEEDNPQLASAVHRYIVNTLSHRLAHSNKTLFALRQ